MRRPLALALVTLLAVPGLAWALHAGSALPVESRNPTELNPAESVPASSDVPAPFWFGTERTEQDGLILDVQVSGAVPGTGIDLTLGSPFGRFHADAFAASWTGWGRVPSTFTFQAWHGWWNDANGNQYIDDEVCGQPSACSATDEFVPRGLGVGQAIDGVTYLFPMDADLESPARAEPSGLAGDCVRWKAYAPGCVSPEPDVRWVDETADPDASPGWRAGWGGGTVALDESLLAELHAFHVFGAPLAWDFSAERGVLPPWVYRLDCLFPCYRDYDRYQVPDRTVTELYTVYLHVARDEVYTGTLDRPLCALLLEGECALAEEPVPDVGFDFDGHYEASDTCAGAFPTLAPGDDTTGTVAPPVDPADYYRLDAVTSGKYTIDLYTLVDGTSPDPALDEAGRALEPAFVVRVWKPGCAAIAAEGVDAKVLPDCEVNGLERLACWVSRDTLEFTAEEPGDYAIEVRREPPDPVDPGVPTTLTCDPICSRFANLGGYRLSIN